jgi:hypothetical protein
MRKFVKATLRAVAALALLVIGLPTVSMAAGAVTAPEIDATTGVAALGLIAGAVLVIRGRRKK